MNRRPEPSARITMSHRSQPNSGSQLLYDRVEILPPSGDHAGASPFAIDVTPDPSGFMTAITALPFPSRPYRLVANAIFDPSAFITHTTDDTGLPAQSLPSGMKAMRAPFGDHAGWYPATGIGVAAEPSAIIETSPWLIL